MNRKNVSILTLSMKKGMDLRHIITSTEVGLYNAYKKNISNPATAGKEGGQGKFYNNDGEAHTYRIAVTPDNRAFIYRDGMPIDSVRNYRLCSPAILCIGNWRSRRKPIEKSRL